MRLSRLVLGVALAGLAATAPAASADPLVCAPVDGVVLCAETDGPPVTCDGMPCTEEICFRLQVIFRYCR